MAHADGSPQRQLAEEELRKLRCSQEVLRATISATERTLQHIESAQQGGASDEQIVTEVAAVQQSSPQRHEDQGSPYRYLDRAEPPGEEPFAASPQRNRVVLPPGQFTGRVLAVAPDGAASTAAASPQRGGAQFSPQRSVSGGGSRAMSEGPAAAAPPDPDTLSPQERLDAVEQQPHRSRAGLWSAGSPPRGTAAAGSVPLPHKRAYRSYGDTERPLPPAAPPVV
eukprot:TRINITY_DN10097_c5_g1_i1.p1 TRINITY_DN10097_c5_g1~~TRINITY_DN10097_c5_g1_i1.p1  ORF type:complete len:250 (+),score=83.27 TRINITY_DN10097_c5_g1_i1:78-752(+)